MRAYPAEPIEAGLTGARSLAVVERTSSANSSQEPQSAFYHSSLPIEEGCARRFAQLIRGHWGGCEIRNHWVRDALFGEDQTRSKNWKLNANLATLRACALALKSLLHPESSWPTLHERCQHQTSIPYQMVANHRSK